MLELPSFSELAPEEAITDPITAVGHGYCESKWVGETLLDRVADKTGLPVTIVRVGQLAGARSNGVWNTQEWFPSVVKSSGVLRCFPEMNNVSCSDFFDVLQVDTHAMLVDLVGSNRYCSEYSSEHAKPRGKIPSSRPSCTDSMVRHISFLLVATPGALGFLQAMAIET